jgi:recombination protein RecA
MAKDDDKKVKDVPRGKDLTSLSAAINKQLGANISCIGTDVIDTSDNTYLYPTGILSLDKYLGVGGLLGGRIMNAWGWQGTGKTLTALTIAGQIQRSKFSPHPGNPDGEGRVAFLDAEGTYSPTMARAVGVDPSKLLLFSSTPERILTGEDYFDIMKILIQNGIEFIIVDSLPALVPSSRMTATIGTGQKATSANLIAEGLQQITPLLNGFKRSIVWMINQIRMKPMVMFGPTEEHTGGQAIKFFESYSLEVKKAGDIIKKVPSSNGQFEERRIGVTVKARLHKNKTASIPVEAIDYDIYFENVVDDTGAAYTCGVDVYKDVTRMGVTTGVIEKASSWFNYGDIKGNGMDNFIAELRKADRSILEKIRNEVLNGKPQAQ